MRIFITGASGFIGGAIARSLARDHSILAMSRSDASDEAIRALGASPVRSELGAVLPAELARADAVIHCAAFVKQWGTREEFWSANVEGTRQLLGVARTSGVKRFIHIGTEAALFAGQHMREIDEKYPYPERTPFLYSETKGAAERLVLAANGKDFSTVSIRPRFVWGPQDRTILPALVAMVESGRFSWIDGGRARTSTTHISNLVHGVRLSLTQGPGGNAYFIADYGSTRFRDFITALLATQGVAPPNKSVPGWLARSLAFATEKWWRGVGRKNEPPITRFAAALMSRDCTLKIDKARRDLGYEPVISRENGLAALARTK